MLNPSILRMRAILASFYGIDSTILLIQMGLLTPGSQFELSRIEAVLASSVFFDELQP